MGALEAFFGLGEGSLASGGSAIEGSAIRAQLSLSAGSELSFDFFFDAGDTLPRNDFALAVIGDRAFKLSDVAAIAAVPSTRDVDASGWRTFVYKVPTSGVYTIGFAAVDDRIAADPSQLYIDNVRINRQFGADYMVIDGTAEGSWRTLVQRPIARDDALTVGEDAVVTTTAASLLANDTDPDPFDPMGVTGIDRAGTVGDATYASGGAVTYRAAGHFNRLAEGERATDSFRYEMNPGNGTTSQATVRVTIIGINDAPTARADVAATAANSAVLIDVLGNDDDVDSDDDRASLRIVEVQAVSGNVSFTGQSGAGVAYDPAGRYVYLGAGETATDTITYVIQDRHGARATGTVGVTVTGVNDTPTALDDVASTNEDAATTIAVLANDSDPDRNDRLSATEITGPEGPGTQVALASGAIVGIGADGTLRYDPNGRFDHLALGETTLDSFRYGIADGQGGTAEARATVRIEGRNDAPVTGADIAAVGEDNPPIFIDILANDEDIDTDDDPSSLRVVTAQSASGADVQFSGLTGAGLSYAPAGRFDYLAEGEMASDAITYTVEDRHGARATGRVVIAVIGANDAPVASDDQVSTNEDSTAAVALLGNDTDPDRSDRLQVTAVNGEAIGPGGRVTLASGASVTMDAAGAL
jgi:VCBS repeat-containing protein